MRNLTRAILMTTLALGTPVFAQSEDELRQAAQEALGASDFEAAAANFRKLLEVNDEDARAWHLLGYSLHALGKLDEALEIHKKATEFPAVAATATYNIACVYALKNDKDKALSWLGKAVEAGFANVDHIETDSDMDNVRDDPRFKKLVTAMGSAAASPKQRAFSPITSRKSQRLAFWGGRTSGGQLSIDYGQPAWQEKYAKAIRSANYTNRRWRMGADFWTTLDTNVPLTLGGVKVPAGYYYLTAEHKGDGEFVMQLNDPAQARKKKLDAFVCHMLTGGIEVPLKMVEAKTIANKLSIKVKVDPDNQTDGELVVHYGPHALVAPMTVHLESKSKKAKY